jgi:hypothetical protein
MNVKKAKTLILMSDNRAPDCASFLESKYYSLASVINYLYAKEHGYDFRFVVTSKNLGEENIIADNFNKTPSVFYQKLKYLFDVCYIKLRRKLLNEENIQYRIDRAYNKLTRGELFSENNKTNNTSPGSMINCRHEIFGSRSAPWSKLPAIYNAMNDGYSRIFYIDSDAFVNKSKISVDDYIYTHKDGSSFQDILLFVTFNYPWLQEGKANSGFMIWECSENSKDLIKEWWNYDADKYHTQHDYEQNSFNTHVIENKLFEKRIKIIEDITFLERDNQFFRHISHSRSFLRIARMREQLFTLGINKKKFKLIQQEILTKHIKPLDTYHDLFIN